LEGNGGEGLRKKKKNEQMERQRKMGRESFRGLTFLHNTKPFSFEKLKNCRRRVLKGLYEFFKFNLCCYIIFIIKNIVIICINLSFSTLLIFLKDFYIFTHIFHRSKLYLPLSPKLANKA